MKFKKILSSVIAAAMAVTTFSAFSTTATAEDAVLKSGGSYVAAPTSWDPNTIDTTFTTLSATDLANVEDNALITITVVPNENADTSDWAVSVGETMSGSWANSGAGTATSHTVTAAKLLEIAGIDSFEDLTSAYNVQIWNMDDGESIDSWSITYDNDYVVPTTDVWVDNGDGSYTYTRGTLESNLPSLDLATTSDILALVSCDITVEGTDSEVKGQIGACYAVDGNNWGGWHSVEWSSNNKTCTFGVKDSDTPFTNNPAIQVYPNTPAGAKITVSNISTIQVGGRYLQSTEVDENGYYDARAVMLISEEDAANYDYVEFQFSVAYDIYATRETTKCYKTIKAGGTELTAPDGYLFVAYAISDIPESRQPTFRCTKITLKNRT